MRPFKKTIRRQSLLAAALVATLAMNALSTQALAEESASELAKKLANEKR